MDDLKLVLSAGQQNVSIYNGLIILNALNAGRIVNQEILDVLRTRRLVPIRKREDSDDLRPVGIGEIFLNLAAKCEPSRRQGDHFRGLLQGVLQVSARVLCSRGHRGPRALCPQPPAPLPGACLDLH
jgi:hypothetical protein